MKYDIKEFNLAVGHYKKGLEKIRDRNIMVILDNDNKGAFLSIAPLSRAAHELKKDIYVIDRESNSLGVLLKTYDLFEKLNKKVKSEETKILEDFIKEASRKIGKEFVELFKRPFIIRAEKNLFANKDLALDYKADWFKDYKKGELLETCRTIWKEVYDIKKNETVSISFELIPEEKKLELPLEDYLDSYAIVWAMATTCYKKRFGAVSSRFSQLEKIMPVSDLSVTLLGCELSKTVKEPVFAKFNKLSKVIKANMLKPADATFAIHGKGVAGRHVFGEKIGYPSLDRKTRWSAPGGIIYKLDWYPQTKIDKRPPMSRIAFTETLPIDIFIKTCNIDWEKLRRRTKEIKGIMEKCEKIIVEGKKVKGGRTSLIVNLVNGKKHRWARADDGYRTRHKIHLDYFKRTGIKAGTMSNIPAGEVFITPEDMKGTFVGDVVISIDQSYILSEKDPIVIKVDKKGYKILKGPQKILKKFSKKKRDAWKLLKEQEKHKSLPKKIIGLKKKNFNKIGEFAINTNPKAELCKYLIVNEKIANMIHIALGSGFEPDRPTEYHTDIVINAPRQKLDIYGVRGKEKLWILKKGKFVV